MTDTLTLKSGQVVTPAQISATLDRLALRKKSYMGVPEDVMEDLRSFCRADTTCWSPDARVHAELEGRREVFLRIQEHQTLTPEQLLVLYSGGELHVDLLKGTEYAR